jgi:hypothetical protein
MKKLIGFSPFVVFAFLLSLQTGVTSCTKEKTVLIQDTAVSVELLTANSWKLQEYRGVDANTIVFYERGGALNTANFDNEYIRFRSDGTGSYFDQNGVTHEFTWEFLNEAKTSLTFVVSNPFGPSQAVFYENLRYKNDALLFDQYWTYNSINSHAQGIRIPGN